MNSQVDYIYIYVDTPTAMYSCIRIYLVVRREPRSRFTLVDAIRVYMSFRFDGLRFRLCLKLTVTVVMMMMTMMMMLMMMMMAK